MTYRERMEGLKFEFLGKLYELADGSWNRDVRRETLRSNLDWERHVFDEADKYVRDEGLIDYATMGIIRLTQSGADVWEERSTPQATRRRIGF